MLEILPHVLEEYIENHSTDESEILSSLNRRTHLNYKLPQMLSGKVQGNFLSILSQIKRPKRVLEIGTYTGYAAICLAKGLEEGGLLYTIDSNEEVQDTVEEYIQKAGLTSKIKLLIGNAMELIPSIDERFDIVFIDADKKNYCNYFDAVIDKMPSGGLILADNVLWSGKVIDKEKKDKNTEGLRAFNKKVNEDNRVDNVIVSIRDGIMMAIKK